MKKRNIVFALVVCFCCLSGAAILAAASNANASKEAAAIREALIGARTLANSIGQYPTSTGLAKDLTAAERAAYAAEFRAELALYYAKDSSMLELYSFYHEAALNEKFDFVACYIADAGVIDCEILDLQINAANTEANVAAEIIGWTYTIDQGVRGEKIHLITPVVKTEISARMVKEDGRWKVLAHDLYQPIEAEESELKAATDRLKKTDSWPYIEEGEEGFDSFAEALEAAEQIDINDVNPYAD